MSLVMDEPATLRLAADLAGERVHHMVQLKGGRNSRVFRVEATNNVYALKLYPAEASDGRDRLGVETAALRWMQLHGFGVVPRVIGADRRRGAALLSWVEGDCPNDGVRESDVDQACDFLQRLHALRATPAMPADCLAAEACLSIADIERQVRARMALLARLEEPALRAFLDVRCQEALAARLARARAATVVSVTGPIPASLRSQVPSDFGFHNTLRDGSGRLGFVDFEYFGWDDPVKLIADMLLHPGVPIAGAAAARLRERAPAIYGEDQSFAARLDALLPLFALRWALILLNEFRPERWRIRVTAGAAASWEDSKRHQLAAATAMLDHPAARATA